MGIYLNLDEKYLVSKVAVGDEDAFSCLYNSYNNQIYTFVLGYLKSPTIAEDVCQEIFLKIWNDRKRLSDVKSFKSYLFTVSRNYTLNYLRSIFNSKAALSEMLHYFPQNENTTDNTIDMNEYYRYIRQILDTLTPTAREIFRQCREENCSYEEVATALGISKNAVKKHMVKTMKIFRQHLNGHLDFYGTLFLTCQFLYYQLF